MNDTFRTTRWLAAAMLPAALLSAAPQAAPPATAPAPAGDEDTYQGESPYRYAMVRVVDGDVRILKGDVDDDLTRGTPIGEGDVVESRGRGVLQLADGTRVAFGGATRFTVAALFTDQNQERQVLLRLDYGRLRIQMGGQVSLRFKVDTPSGTATCFDRGAFSVEAERDRTTRLLVHDGHVDFANARHQATVAAGDRLTVYSPEDGLDRVRSFNTYDQDEFDRWCVQAMAIRRGESWDHVPPELRYYADELDGHGRWVQSDEYGWVWRPDGVAEDWRPYYDGRWAPYACGMTWISPEPWAYVAYHHGRWHWSVGLGWFWIPGVYYSPAWVAWNYAPGYCGWAPLGYYNTPCHWGYGAWGGGYCWNVVEVGHLNLRNIRSHLHSDVHVLRTFDRGNGGTTWTGGGRSLTPPWRTTPLMLSHGEFRDPAQVQTAFRPEVARDRLRTYDRQAQAATGRRIHFRPEPAPGQARPDASAGGRLPFESPIRRQGSPDGSRNPAPVGRPAPGPDRREGPAPRDRGPEDRSGRPGRELAPSPDRGPEGRPAPGDRGRGSRPAPIPREEPPAPRSRPEEGRPVPSPRPPRYEPVAPRERPMAPPRERPVEPARERPMAPPRERPVEPARERPIAPPRPAPERPSGPPPSRERGPEPRPSGGERHGGRDGRR